MSKKTCFFVSPIGEPDSADRKRSDEALNVFLHPALDDEFKIIRADTLYNPGPLDNEIFQQLKNADLVAVDITTSNPNVFLELGYRKALGKPFFCIKEDDGEKIPFDMQSFYVHHYRLKANFPSEVDQNVQDAIDGIKKMVSKINFTASAQPEQTFEEKVQNDLETIKNNLSNLSLNLQKNVDRGQVESDVLPIEKVAMTLVDLGLKDPGRLEHIFYQARSAVNSIRNIR